MSLNTIKQKIESELYDTAIYSDPAPNFDQGYEKALRLTLQYIQDELRSTSEKQYYCPNCNQYILESQTYLFDGRMHTCYTTKFSSKSCSVYKSKEEYLEFLSINLQGILTNTKKQLRAVQNQLNFTNIQLKKFTIYFQSLTKTQSFYPLLSAINDVIQAYEFDQRKINPNDPDEDLIHYTNLGNKLTILRTHTQFLHSILNLKSD